jgi:X-X-X-Leu-X-X-Gly heptad repeat protein
MKKIIPVIISAILLLTLVVPAAAADSAPTGKGEVVYGILGLDGSVESIYVVNIFNTGAVTDYGDYADVKNLTNTDPITHNGDVITIHSSADQLYYQGTLTTRELPWDFAVSYTLNGKEAAASDLAGASGALSIHIRATQNPDTDSVFFDNYALQIGLSLDTRLCGNIKADGATVADAGTDKQLSYIVLPGKGADIAVSADVHDFEMDAMTLNGIKLKVDMDIDASEFSDEIRQLADAIAELDGGAGDLLDGVRQLNDGMTEYLAGLQTYKNGLGDLSSGASQVASGISGLAAGLGELATQGDALVTGAQSIQQAAFDAVNAQLAGMGLPALTPDNYSAVLSGNASLAAVKAQLDNAVLFTQGVLGYTSGVDQLKAGAVELSGGASQLSSALSQAASGAHDLYDGAAQLNTAIGSLREGLAEYKNGTAELQGGTKDMDSQISEQIDQLLSEISGGDEVKSFVSDKNTDVDSVQFVLKTGAIEIPKTDDTAPVQEKEPTFWDRLLALFGIG